MSKDEQVRRLLSGCTAASTRAIAIHLGVSVEVTDFRRWLEERRDYIRESSPGMWSLERRKS